MPKHRRATVALQYRVRLIGPDGAEWEWRITDSYFVRRFKRVGEEMLEVIRDHDLTYEFGLEELPDELKVDECRFCGAYSVPGGVERHDRGCTRPRGEDA